MPRLQNISALLAVAITACGAPAKPSTITNTAPASRYALQPVVLHGGEGRHSSWQSSTTVTGVLELAGARAVLQLRRTTQISPVHCSGPGGFVGVQACAAPGSQPETRTNVKRFTGELRSHANEWLVELRANHARLSLSCSQTAPGYDCAITSHEGVFLPLGDVPSRLVFGAPPPTAPLSRSMLTRR